MNRILPLLSSQVGEKGSIANRAAADRCIEQPDLLDEIVTGFSSKDKKLIADCIEVFTMTSEKRPDLVVPYAEHLPALLANKENRIRWEAAHTLAFIARLTPDLVFALLPELAQIMQHDKSLIVRDYACESVAHYARTGRVAAKNAFPFLVNVLQQWGERHAKQVLIGFFNLLDHAPEHQSEIVEYTRPLLEADKKATVKEAQKVLKKAGIKS